MKIAFTGSSSTGKTTLANILQEHPAFSALEYVTADARELLDEMGYHSMDLMTREQLRGFQLRYLQRKLEVETGCHSFITERSTVDVAAYWLSRDAFDLPAFQRDEYVEKCRAHASKYDLHIYLPFGLIPFCSDGYRSENIEFHKQIDQQIRTLLRVWQLKYITLDVVDIHSRIQRILEYLGGIL